MKNTVTSWLLGISLTFITACVANYSSEELLVKKTDGLEPIADYRVFDERLAFNAISNGCSKSANFVMKVEEIKENQALIQIVRLEPDNCKRMPFLNKFSMPLEKELLGKKIRLLNPKLEVMGKSRKK